MKRFTAIFLSLLVLISLISIPALAADVDHVGEVYPNLLDQIQTFFWYNDTYDYESPNPFVVYDGYLTTEMHLECVNSSVSLSVDQLFLNFIASSELVFTDITFSFDGYYEYEIISGVYVSSSVIDPYLTYYTYMFDIGSAFPEVFDIDFYFEECEFYQIELTNLYTNFGSHSVSYPGGDVLVQGTMQQGNEGFYNQPFYNDSVELPYTFSTSFESHGGPYNNMMEIYYSVPGDSIGSADQVVFTFISTGVYDNYYDHDQLSNGGITLISPSDTYNIPINAYYSLMDSSWEGMDVWRVSVVADLSGYDLSKYIIQFSTVFFPATPNPSNGGYSSYFFRMESCKFYLNSVLDVPWYRTFYHWIRGELWILDSDISIYFSRLEYKLDDLFGLDDTPPPVTDQQQGMNDVIGDMGGLAEDFENSQNEMEELMPSMPSWEDTGLGDLPGQYGANINQILVIFHAIYENTIITQILTFTFLFALGGFILFGER